MADDTLIPRMPSPALREQFRRNAKALNSHVSDSETINGLTKSYAQVATSVRHQNVGQRSGELKLNDLREFRISVRFSKNERETLVRQAEINGLTMSDHIRIAALGPTYAYAIDPEKYQLLRRVARELGRQGTNLNQIAHAMNAAYPSFQDGETALDAIATSLMDTFAAVRHALSKGRTYDE